MLQKMTIQCIICLILLSAVACSPMPKASYGFVNGVTREHSLDEMEVDIKVGTTWETMKNCNGELWRTGEQYKTLSSGGLIFGCTWVGGQTPGKIDKCQGYATESTLEHELQHCKGFQDHWLFRF